MTTLDDIARAAQAIPGIESAAIFVKNQAAARLDLGAAAGVEGAALNGLVAAAQQAEHPIAQALTDAAPTFNVQPMNPGGPALRSHLPLGGLGVLALAHDASLSPDAREALQGIATSAEAAIRQTGG
jgi:cation transport ATPase